MGDLRAATAPGLADAAGAGRRALIRFLVDVLGFRETAVYADGDLVSHAELAWPPGGGIMLGSVRDDDLQAMMQPGTFAAYVVTDDPEALYRRAVEAGAEIARELYTTDYGSRDFAVRDAVSNQWATGGPSAPTGASLRSSGAAQAGVLRLDSAGQG